MSILKSILNYRCPRCRNGNLFIQPMDLSKPLDMPTKCPNCSQKYEIEPGFFWGAMYVSYGITSILFLLVLAALIWGLDLSVRASFGIVLFIAVVTFLKVMRLSRSIWIHAFVKFDSTIGKKEDSNQG